MDGGGRSDLQPPIVSGYPPTWPTLAPPLTDGGGDLVRVPPPDEMTPGLDREEQGMALLAARFAALGQTVCDPMMQ